MRVQLIALFILTGIYTDTHAKATSWLSTWKSLDGDAAIVFFERERLARIETFLDEKYTAAGASVREARDSLIIDLTNQITSAK